MQETSENPLMKQFGFQPVSSEEHVAQVDWTSKVIERNAKVRSFVAQYGVGRVGARGMLSVAGVVQITVALG